MKKRLWILAVIATMALFLSSCGKVTVTDDQAKEIALAEAGVSVEAVQGLTAHLERDDGRKYYEVDFYVGAVEYDIEVDAETGEIIKYDREGGAVTTTTAAPTTTTTAASTTTTEATTDKTLAVTEDNAKQAALTDAGFAADAVERLTVKLDYDDGRAHYDVEFFKDGTEYDYEIDAETGKIVDKDMDSARPD